MTPKYCAICRDEITMGGGQILFRPFADPHQVFASDFNLCFRHFNEKFQDMLAERGERE